MKKALTTVLVLALVCSVSAGLAEFYVPEHISEYTNLPAVPALSTFARLSAMNWDKDRMITVTLTQPVDKLYANWLGKNETPEELTVGDDLTATFTTVGHKYQVGALWTNVYDKVERADRHEIVWQAQPSRINWATIQAMNDRHEGDCVEVVEPYWTVEKIINGCVLSEYDDDINCTDIPVPDGYQLVKHDGYAVAWYPVFRGFDGSPNYAYITEQGPWTVVYARGGKIMYFTITVPDSEFFGLGRGTGTVRYEKSDYESWYIREVTEVYEDNSSVTATYSKSGNGKLVGYESSGF